MRQTMGISGRERTAIIMNERLGHATSEVVPSSKEFGGPNGAQEISMCFIVKVEHRVARMDAQTCGPRD